MRHPEADKAATLLAELNNKSLTSRELTRKILLTNIVNDKRYGYTCHFERVPNEHGDGIMYRIHTINLVGRLGNELGVVVKMTTYSELSYHLSLFREATNAFLETNGFPAVEVPVEEEKQLTSTNGHVMSRKPFRYDSPELTETLARFEREKYSLVDCKYTEVRDLFSSYLLDQDKIYNINMYYNHTDNGVQLWAV